MNFGILVNEGPYTHQASDSAYQFCKAALAAGHKIHRVFFYHDGVDNATRLTEPPQDDRNVVNRWSKLGQEHALDLVVCVAAALRRGIKDEMLAPGFRISGLGQLIEIGHPGRPHGGVWRLGPEQRAGINAAAAASRRLNAMRMG